MNKKTVRKKVLNLRKALPNESKTSSEIKILSFIKNLNSFKNSKNIGIYFSTKYELSTTKIIDEIFKLNKTCYLPVIQENTFDFYIYKQNDRLIPNRYGILEPQKFINNQIDINRLEIIFVPIVAFDENKNRVGMGGGYYDRALSKLNKHHKPILIGLAFEFQKVKKLTIDPWDIKLDYIITEDNLY